NMRDTDYPQIESRGVSEFFDWVKLQSHQFRGVTFGTMLRDEGYQFIRLGTFMERADNTARIIDVKYHTLLPSAADVGGAVDYYQWSALLRSVSAFDAYRKVYRDVITPMKVAELLILRDDAPRSLHACMNEIYDILRELCDDSQREAERQAGELHAKLHYGRAPQIFDLGLHEYLMEFLEGIATLTEEISKDFLVPVYPTDVIRAVTETQHQTSYSA
ncbi:MAG: alpha-E domain-containing protein, partial [Burkholderiales bacterium]